MPGSGNLDSVPGLVRLWTLEKNLLVTFLDPHNSLLYSKAYPYTPSKCSYLVKEASLYGKWGAS